MFSCSFIVLPLATPGPCSDVLRAIPGPEERPTQEIANTVSGATCPLCISAPRTLALALSVCFASFAAKARRRAPLLLRWIVRYLLLSCATARRYADSHRVEGHSDTKRTRLDKLFSNCRQSLSSARSYNFSDIALAKKLTFLFFVFPNIHVYFQIYVIYIVYI